MPHFIDDLRSMDFSNPRRSVLIRLGLIAVTILLLVNSFYSDGGTIIGIFFLVATVLQVMSLVKHIENQNKAITDLIKSIEFENFTFDNPSDPDDENVTVISQELQKVFEKLKKQNNEKEDEFQYMKNIVHHVGIGLITFDKDGKVQIINTAAKKLLKISNLSSIDELSELSPNLVESFSRLRTGGRDLVRLEIAGDIVQLAVYAIQLTLRGEEFKLVSIQNIQSELEEKEMEAWQNLVRVLTHEIMNSITPITSLANTIEVSLQPSEENKALDEEELEDIGLAIQTIKKRGEGLMGFVQDFRNLTHIPNPKLEEISVKELIDEVSMLLKNEIAASNITLDMEIKPRNMVIHVDKGMISQVLINLVKNAVQAFDEQENKEIHIRGFYGEKARPTITVRDNGNGIDEEALEKIFIPFFTTKQTGSGIGLSLSRQIMRKHQGVLGVKTKIDEGTEFILKF